MPILPAIYSRFTPRVFRGFAAKPVALFSLGLLGVTSGCQQEGIRVYDAPKEAVAPVVQLPEGWKELAADEMSRSKFTVRGQDGSSATIAISVFAPSDELANVNRWRKQVGLDPIDADALAGQREAIDIAGHSAALFDMSGAAPDTGKKTRIVAALLNHGGAMWFFKMTGDDELVAAQKPAFKQFISAYQIPSDSRAPLSSAKPEIDAPVKAPAPIAARQWNAPSTWKEQPAGPMQEAKFSAAEGRAVVTVSVFPGATGGMRANVDRWRNQLGLAPATDAEFAAAQSALDLPDAKATVVDMAGQNNRMVTVIVPRGENTWFFKMLGEPAAVESEKKALLEFARGTK